MLGGKRIFCDVCGHEIIGDKIMCLKTDVGKPPETIRLAHWTCDPALESEKQTARLSA